MDEVERIRAAVVRLESQRDVLGDTAVDAAIAALHKELAALEAVEESRKQVTVLFADLVGFTALSERMDPEDVREVQDALIGAVTPSIKLYGGSVEKYIGDAILAVFGVPQAHEDDPERAILAALGMHSALTKLNERLKAERHISLSMRIGINTGLVVSRVGEDDFVITGDTVNLAARLESAAQPGTVLVSEETNRLAGYAFEMESLGSIQVKGKAGPLPVYRVLGARPQAIKPRGLKGLASPLVGRQAEYGALFKAIQRLRNGEGGIVTVWGEAGIGKSRLLAELRRSILDDEIIWVEGHCLSYAGSIAYLPWLEALRELIGVGLETSPSQVREELRTWVGGLCLGKLDEVYPYLAKLMSLPLEANIEKRLNELDGRQLREATFQAMESVLACAANECPLVILIEDLHWADPSSLALLEHLLPLITKVPFLFAAVFRTRQETGSWGLREAAAREFPKWHSDIHLEALSAADSEQLVDNLLGWQGLPGELVERILDKAEGNPFFVEEVIRSLMDNRVLVHDPAMDRWLVTKDVETVPIPDTLQGVLTARIDRLQRATKRVLQQASIIGRVFLYRILAAIAVEERQLDEKLLTLQSEEMIRERARMPELEYIFKHALTQEAAYNSILKKQRRVFHRQVGIALEHLFPDRQDEILGLLAFHWEHSGESKKAVDYLQRAGDQARNLYAHQEAIGYYQRALTFQESLEDYGGAARTQMKLGQTYHSAFDYRRANESYQAGFRLWGQASQRQSVTPFALSSQSFRFILGWDPSTLEPGLAGDLWSGVVIGNMFSGLLELTPQMDVVPDLAQEWEILEGGRKYIFHLREDARWSDGMPLTAHDFVNAWRRLLIHSPMASLFYDIKGAMAFNLGETSAAESLGVRASDPYTLEVELEEPVGYFLQLMAQLTAFPVPHHVVERFGAAWTEAGNIVSNGPFRIESRQPGKSLTLVRNPEYHGHFNGNLQRMEIIVVPPSEWLLMVPVYEAGDLDVLEISYFSSTEVNRLRRQHSAEYLSAPRRDVVFLLINTLKAPFDDPRVRRAFMLALDREVLSPASGGAIIPARGGLIPPGIPGHSPEIGLPYDPDGARELLAQAGFPGGHGFPSVEILLWSGTAVKLESTIDHWREVLGVETTLDFVPMSDFDERSKLKPPHMLFQAWDPDYPDPDNFLRMGLNKEFSGWRGEVFDSLIESARRNQDQGERIRLYQRADKMLIDEAIVLPLGYFITHLLIKPWVKNYPLGVSSLKDVVIEPH